MNSEQNTQIGVSLREKLRSTSPDIIVVSTPQDINFLTQICKDIDKDIIEIQRKLDILDIRYPIISQPCPIELYEDRIKSIEADIENIQSNNKISTKKYITFGAFILSVICVFIAKK